MIIQIDSFLLSACTKTRELQFKCISAEPAKHVLNSSKGNVNMHAIVYSTHNPLGQSFVIRVRVLFNWPDLDPVYLYLSWLNQVLLWLLRPPFKKKKANFSSLQCCCFNQREKHRSWKGYFFGLQLPEYTPVNWLWRLLRDSETCLK